MIVLGADTHKRSHTIAAVAAATGELLGQRAALLDRLHRRVAAEHDLHLLVDGRVDHLAHRGVEPAEARVEFCDLFRRDAQRDADLQVGRLLVVAVGVHLVPGVGQRADVDLLDAVDQRHLEA